MKGVKHPVKTNEKRQLAPDTDLSQPIRMVLGE